MSFKDHFQALLDQLGVDYKALRGLPAYAGVRTKPFSSTRSAYNWTDSSTRILRSHLSAYDTQRVLLHVLGHSGAGGGGDVTLGLQDPAGRIRKKLDALGASSGSGWILPDPNLGANRDFRLSSVGTWSASNNDSDPYVYSYAANAEYKMQSDAPGTVVEVLVSNNTGPLQIYVNEVLQETYTGPLVGGVATSYVMKSYSGLPFARHSIRVKSTNTQGVAVIGFRVRNDTGIEVSNLGRGGAEIADWIDPDINSNNGLMAVYYMPHIAIVSLGANEALAGTAVTTMKPGYQSFITNLKTAGVAVILLIEGPPATSGSPGLYVPPALWAEYLSAYYDLADTNDIPLIDSTHAFGSSTNAFAMGMISADTLHLNRKGYGFQAEIVLASLLDYINLAPGRNVADLEYSPALGREINAQTGTTYTVVSADIRKWITSTNGSASTLTIPPNTSVPIPLGAELMGSNEGVGNLTLTAGSGVTLSSRSGLIVKQGCEWKLKKVAMPNTWRVLGNVAVS